MGKQVLKRSGIFLKRVWSLYQQQPKSITGCLPVNDKEGRPWVGLNHQPFG